MIALNGLSIFPSFFIRFLLFVYLLRWKTGENIQKVLTPMMSAMFSAQQCAYVNVILNSFCRNFIVLY